MSPAGVPRPSQLSSLTWADPATDPDPTEPTEYWGAHMLVDDVHDGKTPHADLAPFSMACFEAVRKEQAFPV